MKRILWQWLNDREWKSSAKTGIFIILYMILICIVGLSLWFPLSIWFPGIDALVCIVGYPTYFVGYVGGIVYLCRHEFS